MPGYIFYVPFAAALATTLAFLYADELREWKIVAVVVFLTSSLFWFFWFVGPMPFVIPFLMQIGLAIAILFYFRLRQFM